MNRRGLLQRAVVTIPFLSGMWSSLLGPRRGLGAVRSPSRARPGDPAWPSEASWNQLNRNVKGELVKVRSPLTTCTDVSASTACAQVFKDLENPYYLGDEIGLTQSLGWVDAWISSPSVYAVAARTTADDVVAAVNFAREHNLRLVVRRRPQLPRDVQRAGLSADLDEKDKRCHRARCVHRCRVRRTTRAAAGGHGRGGCHLGPDLRCGHDAGGPLCPGRRLPDRRRCRPDSERRFRKLSKSYGMAAASLLRPRSSRPMAR